MFQGNIYSINDFDEACRLSNQPNTVVLGFLDQCRKYFGEDYRVLEVSYLLPPYDACEAENLGDWDSFYTLYYTHLNNDNAQSYIASIFAGLITGKTIFCYVPEDEMILEFFPAFADYMESAYGLTIGNSEHDCMFNTQYIDKVKNLVLRFGYVDPNYLESIAPSLHSTEEDNCPWKYVIPDDAI